jgi:hypothetical protein
LIDLMRSTGDLQRETNILQVCNKVGWTASSSMAVP